MMEYSPAIGGFEHINALLIYIMRNNDSLPPKDTTFHHLAYVARWSPTTF